MRGELTCKICVQRSAVRRAIKLSRKCCLTFVERLSFGASDGGNKPIPHRKSAKEGHRCCGRRSPWGSTQIPRRWQIVGWWNGKYKPLNIYKFFRCLVDLCSQKKLSKSSLSKALIFQKYGRFYKHNLKRFLVLAELLECCTPDQRTATRVLIHVYSASAR